MIPHYPGVYRIIHRPSGDSYVGATANLHKRAIQQKTNVKNRAKERYGNITRLQRRFTPFRSEDFIFEMLEVCPEDQLEDREVFWINRLLPSLNTSRFVNRGFGRRTKKLCSALPIRKTLRAPTVLNPKPASD